MPNHDDTLYSLIILFVVVLGAFSAFNYMDQLNRHASCRLHIIDLETKLELIQKHATMLFNIVESEE